MKKLLLITVTMLFISLSAKASLLGDPNAGKTKSTTCAACHGADGNSAIDIYPSLAGQDDAYLTKQLKDFKSKERADPIMAGMSATLTDQDIADLTSYFSMQSPKDISKNSDSKIGESLYNFGDPTRQIAACSACHGPSGKGLKLAKYPRIANQQAGYLKAQLQKFRSNQRANDLNAIMQDNAQKLTDKDIEELVSYILSLK